MISEILKDILTEIKSLNIYLSQKSDSIFFFLPIVISFSAIIISIIALLLELRKHKSNIKVYSALTTKGTGKKTEHYINIILVNLSYRPSTIINIFLLERKSLSPFDKILQYIPKEKDIDLPLAVGPWTTVKFKLYLSNYLNHDIILIDMDKKAYIVDQKSLKCQKTSAKNVEGNLYFRLRKRLFRYKERLFKD